MDVKMGDSSNLQFDSQLKEIVIYGRGGQGAVTAAQLIAYAAFYDGKQSQAFPNFGVERRGAPVQAFCRISDNPINLRSQVYNPHYVIIFDSTLLKSVDLEKLYENKGMLIINTNKKPSDLETNGVKTFTIDASSMALEIFKSNIVNTAMVAAFSAFTLEISKEAVIKGLADVFTDKNLLAKNTKAVERIFEICNNVKDRK